MEIAIYRDTDIEMEIAIYRNIDIEMVIVRFRNTYIINEESDI